MADKTQAIADAITRLLAMASVNNNLSYGEVRMSFAHGGLTELDVEYHERALLSRAQRPAIFEMETSKIFSAVQQAVAENRDARFTGKNILGLRFIGGGLTGATFGAIMQERAIQ